MKRSIYKDHRPFAAFAKPPRNSRLRFWLALLPVPIFVAAILITSIAQPGTRLNNAAQYVASLGFFFVALGIPFLTIGTLRHFAAKNVPKAPNIHDFITRCGWIFKGRGEQSQLATELLPDSVGSYTSLERFDGVYHQHTFIGTFVRFRGDSNDHHKPTIDSLCLRFTLQKVYPFMIVQRRTDAGKLARKSIGRNVSHATALHLEGGFNNYFDITILPNSEQDVLTFLTPDFMDELMNTLYDFSFEIGGHELYIYNDSNGVLPTVNTQMLHNLLGGADVLFKQIHDVQESWNTASTEQEIKSLRDEVTAYRSKARDMNKPTEEWMVYGIDGQNHGVDR